MAPVSGDQKDTVGFEQSQTDRQGRDRGLRTGGDLLVAAGEVAEVEDDRSGASIGRKPWVAEKSGMIGMHKAQAVRETHGFQASAGGGDGCFLNVDAPHFSG